MRILISIMLVLLLCFFHISCFNNKSNANAPALNSFCSGPVGGGQDLFASGVIESAGRTLGVSYRNRITNGSYENLLLMTAGESSMGLVLEDTFHYAVNKGISDNNLTLIAAAARLKILMVAFYSDVYILVNKNSGINSISDLSGKKVNIAEENSGTYVTARTILDTYTFTTPPIYNNDSTSSALDKVVSGEYDALVKVTANPSGYFGSLTATSNVKFIQAKLYGDENFYDQTGSIIAAAFPFQNSDIVNNIKVRVLLVGSSEFDTINMSSFIRDLYANKDAYAAKYISTWNSVTVKNSLDYFSKSPYAWNLSCVSYLAGIEKVTNTKTILACGTAGGSTEQVAADLVPVIKNTLGLDLDVMNTSGSPEMAIDIANGNAAMGIVVEDVFPYLNSLDDSYNSFVSLNLRKVMPLFKEDVHVLVNTSSGINTLADLGGKKVCVCEKTSGSYIAARNILRTYGFTKANAPIYYFESPSTAIPKVVNGTYDAIIKVSAQPYPLFAALNATDPVKLIPARIKDGTISITYDTRTIKGSYYPFQNGVDVPNNIYTRGILVVSPALNDDSVDKLIKGIFSAKNSGTFTYTDRWVDVTPENARQYFMKNPYGWSRTAVEYYLADLGYGN